MKHVAEKMPAFRHEFYALAIKADGDGAAVTGQFSDFPKGSTVFFNTPFQLTSWDIVPNWKGYYLMFSQEFIAQSNILSKILDHFPFLKMEQSIPFEIPEDQLNEILIIYKNIWVEYYSNKKDKFNIIEANVYLLLNIIKRLFDDQIDTDSAEEALKTADLKLLSRYQSLIQSSFYPETDLETFSNPHSTSFYADKLNVHPNHLNSVVKNLTGITASKHIQNHILSLAKSYLAQTEWSIKEIAYTIHFETPNNFSSFFKKSTKMTPGEYRKNHNL